MKLLKTRVECNEILAKINVQESISITYKELNGDRFFNIPVAPSHLIRMVIHGFAYIKSAVVN